MNWFVFAIAAWIFFGLEFGLRDAFQIGHLPIAPSFVLIFLTFLSIWAPRAHVLWAALILGAGLDLLTPISVGNGESIAVLGPNALGCALGVYTVLNLRAMMLRKNVLTVGFLTLLVAVITSVVAVALLTMRAMYDITAPNPPATELGHRLASALATALAALIVGNALTLTRPLFGFHAGHRSRFRTH